MKGQTLKPEMGKAEIAERSGSKAAPADMAIEPYIDKHEVARRMGSTTRTVDSMMRRGLIPYYKFGYRVAFRWSEIESHLVETCRVCPRSERAPAIPADLTKTK